MTSPAAQEHPEQGEGGQFLRLSPQAYDQQPIPAEALGHIHFIGIGGVGMSGLARIYAARGFEVSGSDIKDNRELVALRALGVRIHVGHQPANLAGADTVVVSTAIRDTNPEVAAARQQGLRILHRAQALAAAMVGSQVVAVAGTHGKTTTTSMLTVVLQGAGLDPSFAIGGSLNESGANAHSGTGEIFVAEADESDGSFLAYSPTVAIVTNIEADHLDFFGTAEAVDEVFRRFVERIVPGGTLVACVDDPGAARLVDYAQAQGVAVITYGQSESAQVRVVEMALHTAGSTFDLVDSGSRYTGFALSVPGQHNVLNAAAAYCAASVVGRTWQEIRDGLESFTGTRRRFELKGMADGVRVIDDYAHHPTEVQATVQAARQVADSGRLVVAFQPHRYSRTAAFVQELGQALALADEVVVMEVYAAGEDPIPGASGSAVAAAVPLDAQHVVFEPSWSAVAAALVQRAAPGDLILTLGAGDVTMLGAEVVALLEQRA